MKKILFTLFLFSTAIISKAAPLVIENFESVAIGTKWTMWGRYGIGNCTATVEADPQNSSNHVLHVKIDNWNTFPEFQLPEEYAGIKMRNRFHTLRYRLFRPNSDQNDYKQIHAFYGNDQIYYDGDGNYPNQGNKNVWQQRTLSLGKVNSSNTSTLFRFGFHNDNSEYYLDDIALYGDGDEYTTYETGELSICEKNTSSTYKVYTEGTNIPEGTSLNVYTSRYTDFNPVIIGSGTLNIYSGGERTYIGEHSNKTYPDWTKFTGDVHIYKYNKVETGAGFYGVIMGTNGKTFSPTSIDDCVKTGKVCNSFSNNRVFLHDGAAIAFENGTRAAQYGELNTYAGSRIYGYYKTGSTGSYLLIGSLNTDATLAGRIAPSEQNGKPLVTSHVGLIKEGTGTYTITGNDNVISGGIRIIDGRINICNDAGKAKASMLSGGTGTPDTDISAVYVMGQGVLGGTGNIAGSIDVYGILEPGTTTTPGTLFIKDYAANAKASVRVHPEGILRFKIKNTNEYDKLEINNTLERSDRKEDLGTSTDNPRIKIILDKNNAINAGDEFTIITASERANADTWEWKYIFPEHLTWKAEERKTSDGRYALVITVTSLEDDPTNKGNEAEDGDEEDNDDELSNITFKNDGDTHTLRYYADKAGLRIGVAVPSSRINITNASDAKTKKIISEFNMVVPENELKFDWTEGSRNSFNYAEGDKLLNFAKNNNMYMRGHTLAWHSQLPTWVSSNGQKNDKNWTKDELMSVLKNHIEKLVGHFKGQIGEWDVVNECLDNDQSIVINKPDAYKLRQQSVFSIVCGEAFIDSAFVWAHRADPDAKLYLNDYDNEYKGNAKSEAFYNLTKRLVNDNIPIHGVGFQCHLDAGSVNAKALKENIERYKELGLECAITELDLGISATTEEQQQMQARDFYRILDVAMNQEHCKSVMIWGLTDDMSWRSSNPLLFNSSLQAKPAYYATRSMLSTYLTTGVPSIEESIEESSVIARDYYSIDGMKLRSPSKTSMTIVRERLQNGTIKTYKIANLRQ